MGCEEHAGITFQTPFYWTGAVQGRVSLVEWLVKTTLFFYEPERLFFWLNGRLVFFGILARVCLAMRKYFLIKLSGGSSNILSKHVIFAKKLNIFFNQSYEHIAIRAFHFHPISDELLAKLEKRKEQGGFDKHGSVTLCNPWLPGLAIATTRGCCFGNWSTFVYTARPLIGIPEGPCDATSPRRWGAGR